MAKTKKNGIVEILRELRPMLPGKAEKDGLCHYIVDNKCRIELNYYCAWVQDKKGNHRRELPKSAKTCHPVSISVKLKYPVAGQYPTTSTVFRTRTFRQRQDGTINLQSVAVAATKCVEAWDNYAKLLEKSKEANAEKKKLLKEAQSRLAKKLPKKDQFERTGQIFYNSSGNSWSDKEVYVNIDLEDDKVEYHLSADDLTEQQVVRIIDIIRENA